MNLQVSNRLYFIIILFFALGCTPNKYQDYYEKSGEDWADYLQEIGVDNTKLKNSVLLVLQSSECSPSIAELKWWDEFQLERKYIKVKLIILEKYATTFESFLNHEEIMIPAYRDSSGAIFRHDLIPSTPMKVHIDKKAGVKKISFIGTSLDPEQKAFFEN